MKEIGLSLKMLGLLYDIEVLTLKKPLMIMNYQKIQLLEIFELLSMTM